MGANTNPLLDDGFCTTGIKNDIPETLRLLGLTPENPILDGRVVNKIFNMIFENLNHQKKKAISFWEPDEYYIATVNNIDICRRNNKIYFCKQTHNDTGDAPKDPATNLDYWTVLYDLDKPLESTYALINHNHDTTYAKLGGLTTQKFKVANATANDDAVSKQQLDNAVQGFLSDNGSLISANGYFKLSNGLIFQWGRFISTVASTQTVNFPISFPNQVFALANGSRIGTTDVDNAANWTASINSNSTFLANRADNITTNYEYTYMAIGY